MQASKIIPGHVYALSTRSDGLQRFRVTAVITKRTGPQAMHARSEVEGYVVEGDEIIGTSGPSVVRSTDAIMGPYEEYAELVAQKERQQAAIAASRAAKVAARDAAIERLSKLLGEKVIGGIYNGITIDDAGLPALMALLDILEVNS